jgi:hypothetical protein
MKSPALDRALLVTPDAGVSKFGRKIAVDLKADADFHQGWSGPGHVPFLLGSLYSIYDQTNLAESMRVSVRSMRNKP